MIFLLILGLQANFYTNLVKSGDATRQEIVDSFIVDSYVYVDSFLIKEYLRNNYTKLSKERVETISEAIVKYSDRYIVNPLVVLSVIENETHFNHNTTHDLRTVYVHNKPVKVNAIGLGGIIFEFWGTELIKNKIISDRTDLYCISNNIQATAYILSRLFGMRLKYTRNKLESGLLRYYGGNRKWYPARIIKTMKLFLNNYIFKY